MPNVIQFEHNFPVITYLRLAMLRNTQISVIEGSLNTGFLEITQGAQSNITIGTLIRASDR